MPTNVESETTTTGGVSTIAESETSTTDGVSVPTGSDVETAPSGESSSAPSNDEP